jgi:acyl-coenzyme A thioesterase PaaI-like protein
MLSAVFRKPSLLRAAINCFPPYLGTGISVVEIAADFRRMRVEMKKRPYNSNAFGTHFGGSLYAMCDPHYVLLLVALLGRDYIIWDKAARIEFLRPSRGTVSAVFEWSDEQLADIRSHTQDGSKYEPVRTVEIKSRTGELVARVHKTLHIRKKSASVSNTSSAA